MRTFKLWIDDIRPAPDTSWMEAHSVQVAKEMLMANVDQDTKVIVSLDHDAGDFIEHGGDYIEVLKWLEVLAHEYGADFSNWYFAIHSMNPVGCQNMKDIITVNGWNYRKEPK